MHNVVLTHARRAKLFRHRCHLIDGKPGGGVLTQPPLRDHRFYISVEFIKQRSGTIADERAGLRCARACIMRIEIKTKERSETNELQIQWSCAYALNARQS